MWRDIAILSTLTVEEKKLPRNFTVDKNEGKKIGSKKKWKKTRPVFCVCLPSIVTLHFSSHIFVRFFSLPVDVFDLMFRFKILIKADCSMGRA